jgi:hypothetical protein
MLQKIPFINQSVLGEKNRDAFCMKRGEQHEKFILLLDGIPDAGRNMDVHFTFRLSAW